MRKPSSRNQNSPLSKTHSDPDAFSSPPSDVSHCASRTLTTNQPGPAGASPDPLSTSGASSTARVYSAPLLQRAVRSDLHAALLEQLADEELERRPCAAPRVEQAIHLPLSHE